MTMGFLPRGPKTLVSESPSKPGKLNARPESGHRIWSSPLYRRAVSFGYAWSHNGTPIVGATKNSITASSAGTYTCTVAAEDPGVARTPAPRTL